MVVIEHLGKGVPFLIHNRTFSAGFVVFKMDHIKTLVCGNKQIFFN